MTQVCLMASQALGSPIAPTDTQEDHLRSSEHAYYSAFLQTTKGHELPSPLESFCPHPSLVPRKFLDDLEYFHEAFAAALTNIVQRWFGDSTANFPSRMPLEPLEVQLLEWIYQRDEESLMPSFDGHQGNWRADLLLPIDASGEFRICEVNARFPFNAIYLTARMYEALAKTKPPFLETASDPTLMLDSIFAMFDPAKPIYFVRDRECNPTINMFLSYAESLTGMRPTIVHPSALRLIPDMTSGTGYTLHAVVGSTSDGDKKLERIFQLGLQLFVDEYASLAPEMRQHLALYGVNDIRSILLIHDKRILGILQQELHDLVHKHHVLTQEQAACLRRYVIPTIIPGSPELIQLVEDYSRGTVSKDDFILKPVRGGRGMGILFGADLTNSQWEDMLANLQGKMDLGAQYVIQPVITQPVEDLYLNGESGLQACRRIGTYHAVNGKFIALGSWRIGLEKEKTCNRANGKTYNMGSVVDEGN